MSLGRAAQSVTRLTEKARGTVFDTWSGKPIELIIALASKQIAYLRKLKYILPKETLNKLYCTYIRPLLEYASEVWDGCTITDSNRLEQVQLTAARIVTGLPTFSSFSAFC